MPRFVEHEVWIDGTWYRREAEQPADPTLTPDEAALLSACVEKEGFQYAFESYSSYDHGGNKVGCPRFHQLKAEYLEGLKRFKTFLKEHGVEATDVSN